MLIGIKSIILSVPVNILKNGSKYSWDAVILSELRDGLIWTLIGTSNRFSTHIYLFILTFRWNCHMCTGQILQAKLRRLLFCYMEAACWLFLLSVLPVAGRKFWIVDIAVPRDTKVVMKEKVEWGNVSIFEPWYIPLVGS